MVDLVITPANVVSSANAAIVHGTAGAALLAGQTAYRDPTTKKYLLVDADSATEAARSTKGFVLNGAGVDQPVAIHTDGDLTVGAVLTKGTIYVQSDTAGGVMPAADLETGDYVTILGVAKSTTVLAVKINASGVVI